MATADDPHGLGTDGSAARFAIRRLGPGDEAVLTLLAAQADDFDLAGRTTPEDSLSASDAAAYLADPMVLHWVAEEGGRIVGEILCHLLRLPSGEGRELLLYAIGVRAGDRRRGVGTALVREMLGWMEDAGVPLVWVLADNPDAEAFYAASGFERGGEGEQGVLMLLETKPDGDRPRHGDHAARLHRHGRKRRGGGHGH
jgi:predicted N-acetyltransferase YhbS